MHQIYHYDKMSNTSTILLSRLKLIGYLSRLMKSLIVTSTRHKLFYEDQFCILIITKDRMIKNLNFLVIIIVYEHCFNKNEFVINKCSLNNKYTFKKLCKQSVTFLYSFCILEILILI